MLADAHALLATAYRRAGDTQKSLDAARQALAAQPLNATAYRTLAASLTLARQYDTAAVALLTGFMVTGDADLGRRSWTSTARALTPRVRRQAGPERGRAEPCVRDRASALVRRQQRSHPSSAPARTHGSCSAVGDDWRKNLRLLRASDTPSGK
jgi:tetratricopeptide (TPR) repeat protein